MRCKNNIFQIAELTCKITGVDLNADWDKFAKDKAAENVNFTVFSYTLQTMLHGVQMISLQSDDKLIMVNDSDIMIVNREWSYGKIFFGTPKKNWDLFLIQLFYANAVKRKIIQFHASLINCKQRGLMFLGPSGIGKTTQAELWQKYRKAQIINGDLVFVQDKKDKFVGWGTPWHGSSSYCENAYAEVKGMVILRQSEKNEIRRLTGFEMISKISNNIFYPQWLEGGTELCIEVLDHLLKTIPVYELSCRPDEEAVALTEQTIFGRDRDHE